MKLDNRDLVLRGLLVVLPTHLEPYVRALLGDRCPPARLNSLLAGSSSTDSSSHGRPSRGATPVVPDLADLSTQIRILTFRGSDGRYLMPLPPGLGSKLHEVRRFRNDAVHGRPFDADRTLAALVAASEALRLAGADAGRDELRALIAAIDDGTPGGTSRGWGRAGGVGIRASAAGGSTRGTRGSFGGSPARDPLDAVIVDAQCTEVISYADAVAGTAPTVSVRLRRPEPADGGTVPPDIVALPDTIEVAVGVIEDGGGRRVTEPRHLTWDTARPESRATRALALDRANLLQVEQAGPAHVRVELRASGMSSAHRIPGVAVLPPRQWQLIGGGRRAGAALATFIQPDQPAIGAIADQALGLASADGRAPSDDALASAGAERSDALAAAACTILRRRRLAVDPAGQPWRAAPHPIRTAGSLLDARTGTALDIAVMLAAVLERVAVAPTLLLASETVLLGYRRRGGSAIDPASPREAADLVRGGTMGLIDPALAVRTPAAVLHELTGEARDLALDALSDLVMAVPVGAARAAGVRPQPLLERDEDDVVVELAVPPGSSPTPSTPDTDAPRAADGSCPESADDAADEAGTPESDIPGTLEAGPPAADEAGPPEGPAAGAGVPAPPGVEEWKKSLLDLSLRNPLIDRSSRHAVGLCVPPALIGLLEDHINARDLVRLRPSPHGAGSTPADLDEQAVLLTERRSVRADLTGQEYTRRLQSLDAAARTALEETGANNLYLVVGTLVWRTNGRRLHSPLVLVPVNLIREDETYGIALDEAGASTPNFSLLARFEADTGIDLVELSEPVHDAHGIDIEATLERVRSRLRREERAAVVEPAVEPTVHLGLFHFSTYRMWRDLAEDWPTITANPLVGRLLETGGPAGASTADTGAGPAGASTADAPAPPDLDDLDEVVESLPLVADSPQARVVAEAVAGRSLVVQGPPGTGKSQTVANLIFRALASGRTVMFVAEKTSALDVVARRLCEEAGIGDLLLNLHDNGMKPAEVRRTLHRALKLTAPAPGDDGHDGDDGDDGGGGDSTAQPDALRRRLAEIRERLVAYREALHVPGEAGASSCSYYEARQALIKARDGREPDLAQARAAFEARERATGLDSFDPVDHIRLLEEYRRTQERLRGALTPELFDVVLARRQAVLREAGPRADRLRREIDRRKGTSIRELMDSYGDLVTALTPCLLVSPDSVARFFPPHRRYVDIVVFDEASQITVAGAVGAMGRGRSTVVVGDPKQMPPAVPPGVGATAGGDLEGVGDGEGESILDRCVAAGVERRCLTWHYRSRDESLIAFSNRHYYDGALLSFPSPQAMAVRPDDGPEGYGLSLRRVGGTYYRPQARTRHPGIVPNTNPVEARQVVDEVIRRFEARPDGIPSLGVITFNSRQRDLIESELRRTGSERVVEALDAPDGLLVRNLENVQGEERDVILMSVTFSSNERGDLPLNFGSLSHAGGQRRLNVAITRARRQVVVFSSFDPEDLHAERSTHRGLKDLRAYLEQARDGGAPRALPAYSSAVDLHRNEIAERLQDAGLEVNVGVGHSSFEVDLVLGLPGRADVPRVAVLLDGSAWNERGSASDRDLLPVDVLRNMGWARVERVWMPEWVADERGVTARLVEAAGGRYEPEAPTPEAAAEMESEETTPEEATPEGAASEAAAGLPDTSASDDESAALAGAPALLAPTDYRQWHPEGVRPLDVLDRAATDSQAKAQVVEVARAICDIESPISRHRLIVRICRAFGLSRTTRQREARVREALGEAFAYIDEHDFVWRNRDASLVPLSYRRGALDHVDSIEEIHPRELTALMADVRAREPEWTSTEDLCKKALRRLSAKKRKLSARGVLPALTAALEAASDWTR